MVSLEFRLHIQCPLPMGDIGHRVMHLAPLQPGGARTDVTPHRRTASPPACFEHFVQAFEALISQTSDTPIRRYCLVQLCTKKPRFHLGLFSASF